MKIHRVAIFAVLGLLTAVFSGCGSSNRPIAVTLAAQAKATDQGMSISLSASIVNDTKNGGLKWAVTGGGTLTNTSSTGATFVAPATVASATAATVTATSVTDPSKSASAQITVNPAPAISTTSLPAATAGTAYSQTVTGTGGTTPDTWTVSSGTLPPGLSLGSSTTSSVTISGTPTGGGSGSVTLKVADSVGDSATQALAITVNAPPALTISTTSLPAGVIGTAYSQTLAATGGVPSYSWAVTTGSLPSGLTLNATTGVISGIPTGTFTGTTTFTVTLTDSQTPAHASKTATLSISISAPALSITTATLPGGTLGTAYSQALAASGGAGADTWSISSGSLPAGLTLSSAGVISGTPTGTVTGAINFTVKVTDSETPTAQSATKALSITISTAPLSVTTTSLPTGVVGSTYSATLAAAGGAGSYSWAVTTGSLPAGLTLNTSTGAITGTPTASSATFTVTVTDGETPTPQTATKQLTITVNPKLAITTSSLSAGVIGAAYSATLQATGGITTYSWAVTSGSLPSGLSLNASTGAITGTPTGPQVGTISFSVTVTDSESPAKTASANLSIAISATTLTVTTSSLPAGTINVAYSANLGGGGGVSPYTWALQAGSNLPAGLSLSSGGAITGTPTALGTTSFTVVVTDSQTPTAQSATATLSITINNATPVGVTTTSGQLPTGVVNTTYPGATLQASGGTPPYTWSISTGSLPAGLSLNTSTGAITGTPTASGTSNFTVKVTDSSSPKGSATANLSITVNVALAITTTSLPGATVSTAYSTNVNSTGGIGPYTWSITSGSLPAGLTLGTNTGSSDSITGTPTATGTSNFTVTVTDSESPAVTVNQALSITVATANCTNNASLNGHYAMLLQGWTDSSAGEVFFGGAGSFVADGAGNITSGVLDGNDPGPNDGPVSGTVTGTYCLASNNLGTLNLTLGGGASGTATLAFALQSNGNGNIIFYDTGAIQASGRFFKQDTTAFSASHITGNYAFGMIGVDGSSGNRFGVAGAFTASGGSSWTGGQIDGDVTNGTPASTTFTGSSFAVASNGRGTVTLNVTGQGTLNFAVYVVSATQLLAVGIDSVGNPILSGLVAQQSNGPYTNASMNGTSVLETESLSGSGPAAVAGLVTTDGAGNFTVTANQNKAGTMNTLSFSGTYSVSSNGRMTLTVSGQPGQPIFYLAGNNTAFLVGQDNGVSFGLLQAQSGAPFSLSSLSGNFYGGSGQPVSYTVSEQVDQVNLNAGAVTVTGYSNSTNPANAPNTGNPGLDSFLGNYTLTSSTGEYTVTQSGATNGYVYAISSSKFVFLPYGDSNPKIQVFGF